ncbi:tRNA pseudouridine(55) synthase TruB, partial [Candidatus Peregrinibacteria bacterium CG10_big_fil_rev_8_21_14_0_10_49_10]
MRHGFLLIAKPVGPTSHDIVSQVRRTLGEKKIGHLGTLDPAASGLLVLAVGAKALKVVEFFGDLHKEYCVGVRFGTVSTTYDREGVLEEITPKPGWNIPKLEDVRRMIAERFIGKISQVPPSYSAVQVGGERAYRKMRQGKGVHLPARTVQIDACTITSYTYPDLTLQVACGS